MYRPTHKCRIVPRVLRLKIGDKPPVEVAVGAKEVTRSDGKVIPVATQEQMEYIYKVLKNHSLVEEYSAGAGSESETDTSPAKKGK